MLIPLSINVYARLHDLIAAKGEKHSDYLPKSIFSEFDLGK